MRTIAALALLLACAADGRALTLLTAGKTARLIDRPGTTRDVAVFAFRGDRGLAAPLDPRCPATSAVQVVTANEYRAELPLACERWTPADGGFRYADPAGTAGGLREIDYRAGRLRVLFRGEGWTPVVGPVGYVSIWLTVGDTRFLGRFHGFRRNEPGRVVSRRPSARAALGEEAFFDTLLGVADRNEEGIALLERAAARNRRDGRSVFLLGMLRLLRAGRVLVDFAEPSEFARTEVRLAAEALDAAVPLLPDDTRVPGFRAAATYMDGFLRDDPARIALGLAQLRDAVPLNPLFNSFDFIGVVPQTVLPGDPLFAEALANLDLALSNPACVTTLPEICANRGLAQRNLAGSLTLFGDLYAKAARASDANLWYTIGSTDWAGWPFRAIGEDRVANLPTRIQLYQDADPANDPPIVGSGPEACAYCHYK